jgi:pyruvate formate lyase activating enzyme
MTSGMVFHIQRFSIQDGPGIRTSVFLKGCPLRCDWCHNPESQWPGPELVVRRERCIRCGSCVACCPEGEPRVPGGAPCPVCGACAEACPTESRAVAGRTMTVTEVLSEVSRDRLVYEESGGGVTISGGEPLAQPVFLRELLAGCRRLGIPAAIDTCGYAPREDLLEAAALADLVLYDLKGLDEARHLDRTGVSLRPILENLKALAAIHPRVHLRIPLIPGYNDDPSELEGMAQYAEELRGPSAGASRGIRAVSLLPYHRLGEDKRTRLGRVERTRDTMPPTPAQVAAAASIFRSHGFEVLIGGQP